MKCPHCDKNIDGYRGKFSVETTILILSMFYQESKSIYSIVKKLNEINVKTNKMTVKKIVVMYQNTWSEYLARYSESVNA